MQILRAYRGAVLRKPDVLPIDLQSRAARRVKRAVVGRRHG